MLIYSLQNFKSYNIPKPITSCFEGEYRPASHRHLLRSFRKDLLPLAMLRIASASVQSQRTFLSLGRSLASQLSFRVTKKVNVPPRLIFQVVSEVLSYDQFVPFVTQSFVNEVLKESQLPTEAGFRVGWKQYDEKFTCKLSCIKYKQVIAESVTLQLFDHLYNEWNFKEIKNRFTNELDTFVELILKYKFKNPVYNTVSSFFQNQVSDTMIKAFEERAMQLKISEKLKDRLN